MSKVTRGEEVGRDPRRAMTPARKRRIWEARGRKCCDCGDPVPVDGPGVVYDHRIALWIAGSDADKDIGPICKPCDEKKTPQDQRTIAKIKRIQRKHVGEERPAKRSISGRGFDKRFKRKLGKRCRAHREQGKSNEHEHEHERED